MFLLTSKPYSLPVAGINCHSPAAPACERANVFKELSITIRYFRSSGTLFSFNKGSIIGKNRLARFNIKWLFVCIKQKEISSRSIFSRLSYLSNTIFSPAKVTLLGTIGIVLPLFEPLMSVWIVVLPSK